MTANAHWLDARRAEAADRFRAQGVPHRRIEDWKYSDLRAALVPETGDDLVPPPVASVPKGNFDGVAGPLLRFADGELDVASLSAVRLWGGVEVHDLRNTGVREPEWVTQNFGVVMIPDQSAMADASLAKMQSGVAIRLRAGTKVNAPLHLEIETSYRDPGNEDHIRLLIVLEADTSLTLLEDHSVFKRRNANATLSNVGMEVILEPGAKFSHVRLATRAPDIVRVEECAVSVGENARYQAHFVDLGARLSRLGTKIRLVGKNATASLSGVSVLGGSGHADVTTHLTHAVGQSQSTQLFKHVAGGKSRVVYQGKITVAEGADKSDSRQTAKALLLGLRAEADLKPELEIFADDVKCAHGAAVGDLDADSLFYLRARGIPEAEARNMLLRAFLEEAVAEIADEAIRAAVWHAVEDALPGAMLP